MKRVLPLLLVIGGVAHATGFTDVGEDIAARGDHHVTLDGALRLRGEALDNLDLDRGLTPSGQPLFPIPLSDPRSQWLTTGDLRLRDDLAVYAPGAGVAVKLRVDFLGDQPLGGPNPLPAGAGFHIRRAYGEALTPVGLLVAGRTGNQWGLGILANGGDCADCDNGDAADRVAFITPMLGHIWALAYDVSSSGPFVTRPDGARTLALDPSAAAQTITFATLSWRDDLARTRRRRAGKTTIEYGAYFSYRTQDRDVPATYLPTVVPAPFTSVPRGLTATAVDGWLRITTPWLHVEAELALLTAHVAQPSLIPGVLLPHAVDSTQLGGAFESEFGNPDRPFTFGVDAGYASGDPAPGFGAFPRPTAPAPRPGDLDGNQTSAPGDYRVDNFRFHPDYRIDRILFREIIGTVTDAIYVRPHLRWVIAAGPTGRLTASLAVIASRAVDASSTPGGQTPLGIEIDPTLVYESRDGFGVALEHGVLFPLAGLDNPKDGLTAQPAQLIRVRLTYAF
jgi:uncharacterized protein (TIGR04551 family)